jgi:hypothetical protein
MFARRLRAATREGSPGGPSTKLILRERWRRSAAFVKTIFILRYLSDPELRHAPHEHGDDRNKHAHILVSLRKLENGQWVDRKEQFGKDPVTGKYRGPDSDELKHLRERMAHHFNRQLERFGYDVRVDLRSYEARGIQQEPGLHLGKRDAAKERAGVPTKRGEINREIKARNYSRHRIMDSSNGFPDREILEGLLKRYKTTVTAFESHDVACSRRG